MRLQFDLARRKRVCPSAFGINPSTQIWFWSTKPWHGVRTALIAVPYVHTRAKYLLIATFIPQRTPVNALRLIDPLSNVNRRGVRVVHARRIIFAIARYYRFPSAMKGGTRSANYSLARVIKLYGRSICLALQQISRSTFRVVHCL